MFECCTYIYFCLIPRMCMCVCMRACGHLKFVHQFPVGKSTNFLYPSTKDIQTKPPLHSECFFMLGPVCNRWKSGAGPGLEPRVFRWACDDSTTELPSHPVISPTTFHLNPTLLPLHLLEEIKIVYIIAYIIPFF